MTANSLSSLNSNSARLVGPALGGLIVAFGGITGVALVDSITFFLAAGLVALIRTSNNGRALPAGDDRPSSGVWQQWLEGMGIIRARTGLGVLIGLFALTGLGEGVMATMFVVWIKTVIHGGALELGWFMSAQAVGGIVGGLVIGAVGSRMVPYRLAWAGGLLFALLDIALFSYPLAFHGIWLGLALIAVIGIPAAASGSAYMTLLQLATEDSFRGRVFGALGTTMALMHLLGAAIAGVVGGLFSPILLLNVFQGGAYLAASTILLLMSGRLALGLAQRQKQPAAAEA